MTENSNDSSEEKKELKLSRNDCYLSKLIEESIIGNIRENEIHQYIIKKLILFQLFNNQLKCLINKKK